jgi:GxxExxY protein
MLWRRGDAEIIENLLSEQVLDAAIEVHRTLGGPGLLESLYEDALFYELKLRNIPALSQVQIPVTYKNFVSSLSECVTSDIV